MKLLMDKPGALLLIVGIVALVARWPLAGVPAIGGILSWLLLAVAVFFVVGGVWMLFMGRSSDT